MSKFIVDDSKDMQKVGYESGVCPYCGREMIDFQGPNVQDNMIFYDCICEDCGNSFKEWYLCQYDGTWGYPLKKKGKNKIKNNKTKVTKKMLKTAYNMGNSNEYLAELLLDEGIDNIQSTFPDLDSDKLHLLVNAFIAGFYGNKTDYSK